MATVLLESLTDCDTLVNSGFFEIPQPINGPTGTSTGAIILEVIAPGVPVRPDNVSQRCTDLATGDVTVRRYAPGSGWTAWAAEGGGAGGGSGAFDPTAADANLTQFPVIQGADYATLAAAFSISNPNTLQAAVSLAITLAGYVQSQGVSVLPQQFTPIHATRDPTANDDVNQVFDAAGGFDVPNNFKVTIGKLWINTTTNKAFICTYTGDAAAIWLALASTP